jgi:hypothetical protein
MITGQRRRNYDHWTTPPKSNKSTCSRRPNLHCQPTANSAVALFALYYNFVRIHTLRTTPAMAAKVTKRLWKIGDIVDVLEAWENTT